MAVGTVCSDQLKMKCPMNFLMQLEKLLKENMLLKEELSIRKKEKKRMVQLQHLLSIDSVIVSILVLYFQDSLISEFMGGNTGSPSIPQDDPKPQASNLYINMMTFVLPCHHYFGHAGSISPESDNVGYNKTCIHKF